MSQPNQIMYFGDEDFSDFLKRIIIVALGEFHNQKIPPYNGRTVDEMSAKLLTRKDVANRLGRSANWVSKQIHANKLHATILDGIYYISEKSYQSFVKSNEQ